MDRNNENTPAPNQPVDVIRDGSLKATIWRNESENGPFYSTSYARTYRDQEGGFHDTNSFVGADHLKLSELARKVYTRTNALRREDRAQGGSKDVRRKEFRAQRENGAEKGKQAVRDK